MRKISLVIIIGLALLLSGCYNVNSIEKDFEKAGYEPSESTTFVTSIVTAFADENVEVEVYSFTNGKDAVAIVIDFADETDIVPAFESHVFLKSYITAGYEVDELTRKNYVVLPITTTSSASQEIIDVFQGN